MGKTGDITNLNETAGRKCRQLQLEWLRRQQEEKRILW